ncbi:MAG: glycosyltransferase [Ruminococcus sp.]|nr:glycosyltransferase [Ruminococcus sp.]
MAEKNANLPKYTVCMSVYSGENPHFLQESLDSMFRQTHPCSELILVCDGQLGDELNSVVDEFKRLYPDTFTVLQMKSGSGVGGCANAAIKRAKTEYIVKMDSDDIALENRCQRQLELMVKKPQLDMCGAFIEEFDSDSSQAIAIKRTPLTHREILEYSKRRNPFNNQTLVYKKSAAIKAGGYSKFRRCEDYDFVVRMLSSGAVGENIPEVLVRYRVTQSNLERRKNFNNTRSFISVRWRIFRSGYSSFVDFLIPTVAQLALFVLPKSLTGKLYNKFLRK